MGRTLIVVTERTFTCCRLCPSPGDCAERNACDVGLDESQRCLMAPLTGDGESSLLMAPVDNDCPRGEE